MSHGRRRGAEPGGVRRRGRRHQAELSRVRALRRPTTCCSTPAARSAGTADRCSISKRAIAKDEVAGGTAQDRDSRQIHDRQFPARPGVSAGARQDRARVLRDRVGGAERRIRRGTDHSREPVHLRSEGTEEDHRSRRVLGKRNRRADSARRHRRQSFAAGRGQAASESRPAPQRRVRVRAPRRQPAVRARARPGDERGGDVPAHRPVRERVLRRSRRGRAARGGVAVRARPRDRHHPAGERRPLPVAAQPTTERGLYREGFSRATARMACICRTPSVRLAGPAAGCRST